jgi:hypothetical protein
MGRLAVTERGVHMKNMPCPAYVAKKLNRQLALLVSMFEAGEFGLASVIGEAIEEDEEIAALRAAYLAEHDALVDNQSPALLDKPAAH